MEMLSIALNRFQTTFNKKAQSALRNLFYDYFNLTTCLTQTSFRTLPSQQKFLRYSYKKLTTATSLIINTI